MSIRVGFRRIALIILCISIPAAAMNGSACVGLYRVDGAPLVPGDVSAGTDFVELLPSDGQVVSLPSECGRADRSSRNVGRQSEVRARWDSCSGPGQKAFLRAKLDRGCEVLTGRFHRKDLIERRTFTAHRIHCTGGEGADCSVLTAIYVASGGQHSCAILADRTLRCWGANDRGQLGDGTITNRSTPIPVPGLTQCRSLKL